MSDYLFDNLVAAIQTGIPTLGTVYTVGDDGAPRVLYPCVIMLPNALTLPLRIVPGAYLTDVDWHDAETGVDWGGDTA